MRVRNAVLFNAKQIAQIVFGKMSLGILVVVDNRIGECLFVRLPLKDLFFNAARLCRTRSIINNMPTTPLSKPEYYR